MQFIDLHAQYMKCKKEIDAGIQKVLESSSFIMGPAVAELEETLARFVDVKHCFTVSSGTDGLLIALMALGIGKGDEVITTPFTWVATGEVVARLGAKPVFVDVDRETGNIDVNKLESAITKNTKAMIPVSLYGQMPDFNIINRIAKKYKIIVIEDGAQSFGATQGGRKSCGVTTIGVTSFFPTKPLGCYGDGGAVFTDDEALAMKIREIRIHGQAHVNSVLQKCNHTTIGINGRFDTLQAAIVLAKWPHFIKEIEERQAIGAYYSQKLQEDCEVPLVIEGNTHVYCTYTIKVPNRSFVMEALKKKGIPTAIYYPKCIHEQSAYKYLGYKRGDFPVAEKMAEEVLSLPMHPFLTREAQDDVVEAVRSSLPCKC